MLSRLWIALIAVPALAQTEVAELHGESAGDHFGWSTSFVGDVDVDGSPTWPSELPSTMPPGPMRVG